MQHTCIKCQSPYEDNEVDNYYCPNCVKIKNAIAKDLDRKYPTVGQVPSSELTAYDAEAKTLQGPNGRKATFLPTKL